jgi:hypothetical protein
MSRQRFPGQASTSHTPVPSLGMAIIALQQGRG